MENKSLLELAMRARKDLQDPAIAKQMTQQPLSMIPVMGTVKMGKGLMDIAKRMDFERMLARMGANIAEKGILKGSQPVEEVGVQLLNRAARGIPK